MSETQKRTIDMSDEELEASAAARRRQHDRRLRRAPGEAIEHITLRAARGDPACATAFALLQVVDAIRELGAALAAKEGGKE